MKIRPVGSDLFHVDGQTKKYDKANSNFVQLCSYTQNSGDLQTTSYLIIQV
jgi:hypothetical protein